MRLVTYRHEGKTHPGILRGNAVIDLSGLCREAGEPVEMLSLIRRWTDLEGAVRDLLEHGRDAALLSEVRLAAPIPQPPKNVLCLGRNYREHVAEGAKFRGDKQKEPPQHPVFFTKPHTAIIGPEEPVFYDAAIATQIDYEVELAVVIGRQGKNIFRERAYDYIFGYTILNDISARDLQYKHVQWYKGKSLDGTCPIGPCIVTKDEIPDPQSLDIQLRVNGETRQRSNTRNMIFDIAFAIEVLSLGATLEAGDLLATGTPEGVAMGMEPQAWLKPGDVVECEIEKIGVLRNPVGATQASR